MDKLHAYYTTIADTTHIQLLSNKLIHVPQEAATIMQVLLDLPYNHHILRLAPTFPFMS